MSGQKYSWYYRLCFNVRFDFHIFVCHVFRDTDKFENDLIGTVAK